MSDWYPQVVRIEKVSKHENADTLSIVITSLGDYPVIAKLDDYKEGDIAAYIPIDTIVPDTAEFYFLCPKHEGGLIPRYNLGSVPERYRKIKAKKIREIYSQGLLVNLPANHSLAVGDSVVDLFSLTKWEEEEEDNTPGTKKARGENEKRPQGWSMPHYDIDGLRKYGDCILPGEEIVLTEKLHGANAGFCHDGEKLWVKSRNYYKRDVITFTDGEGVIHQMESTDQWWDVARRFNLAEKLSVYSKLVFFGEVYGQVKGFQYDARVENGFLQPRVRFFDIWDTRSMRYLDYMDFKTICQSIKLDMAPELYCGPWLGKDAMYPYAEGKTTLGGLHVREGFVLRTMKERFDQKLGRMQVKLVGEGYNLQK